jgi:4-hydroxy-3-polyprenylbenzoate decarboxylase
MSIILAITGASGAVYSVRLLQVLLAAGRDVHLVVSESGRAVLKQELDLDVDLQKFDADQLLRPASDGDRADLLRQVLGDEELALEGDGGGKIHYHHHGDFMAPIASGSFLSDGMVVCPCSGTTLSAIAHSAANNLIQRAAEVQLKERRKLVLVPREAPLSTLHIENMRRAASAGAVVLPAAPGWYHGVTTLRDLVDFVVGRICDQLGVENDLVRRWGT